jgi:antagonist of KipI
MKQQLFTPFRLDPVSNRVGLRLQGPAFTFAPAASRMESGPVMPGVVQCPNDGTPMILGPDCGTTGGYPRLLSVITADLPLLARIWPGRTVRFRLVDQDEAIAVFRQRMAWTGDFVGEGWADALL